MPSGDEVVGEWPRERLGAMTSGRSRKVWSESMGSAPLQPTCARRAPRPPWVPCCYDSTLVAWYR